MLKQEILIEDSGLRNCGPEALSEAVMRSQQERLAIRDAVNGKQ